MGIWDKYDLKQSEIHIGNLFHVWGIPESGTFEVVVITKMQIAGKIQIAIVRSGEIREIENIKSLTPIDLPKGANHTMLDAYLNNTEFKRKSDGHYIMQFEDEKINLAHHALKDCWRIWYQSPEIQINIAILFLHEFQNVFNLITKSKLSFLKK